MNESWLRRQLRNRSYLIESMEDTLILLVDGNDELLIGPISVTSY